MFLAPKGDVPAAIFDMHGVPGGLHAFLKLAIIIETFINNLFNSWNRPSSKSRSPPIVFIYLINSDKVTSIKV